MWPVACWQRSPQYGTHSPHASSECPALLLSTSVAYLGLQALVIWFSHSAGTSLDFPCPSGLGLLCGWEGRVSDQRRLRLASLSIHWCSSEGLVATMCRFFPAVVYLASSKFSIAVLGNLGFALALTTYKIITTVRPAPFAACVACVVATYLDMR